MGFWTAKHLKSPLQATLIASVLFPFVVAAFNSQRGGTYLERVMDGYFPGIIPFVLIYGGIQILLAYRAYHKTHDTE